MLIDRMPYDHIVSKIHSPALYTDPLAEGLLPLIDEMSSKRIGWIDGRNEKLMAIFKRHSGYGVEIDPSVHSVIITTPKALLDFTTAASKMGDWPQAAPENIPLWLNKISNSPDAIINRMSLYPLGVMARGVHLICKDEDGNYILARRSNKVATYKNALDVSVGGFVGEGMTPVTALKDESLGEIGLDSAPVQFIVNTQKPRTYEYITRTSGFPTETNGGVWHDRVYAWTSILSNDFKPEFNDGETKDLVRVSPKELITALQTPAAVKVNSAMMLLDDLYLSGHFKGNKEGQKYVETFVRPLRLSCDF